MLRVDHELESQELQEENEDDRVRRFSAANQDVFDRFWYKGKLKVTPSSVDLSRVSSKGGLPFLMNHNSFETNSHVGRVFNAEVKRNVLYVDVQFANTLAADEALSLIDDGFRPGVSIGFAPDYDAITRLEDEDDDDITLQFDLWELLEVSSVPVPALQGVGKLSLNYDGNPDEQKQMKGIIEKLKAEQEDPEEPVVTLSADKTDGDPDLEGEKEELSEEKEESTEVGSENQNNDATAILELGKKHDQVDLAAQAVIDGETADSFRETLLSQTVLERKHSRAKENADQEPDQYSIGRMMAHRFNPGIKSLEEGAWFEIETSNKLAASFSAPDAVHGHNTLAVPISAVFGDGKSMRLADTGADSEWISERTDVQNYLPALIERNPILGLCDVYPDVNGENISIPAITTNPSLSYQITKAATERTDPSDATYMTGRVLLEPHQVSMQIPLSRLLGVQTRGYLQAALRSAIADVYSLAMSTNIIAGTGSNGQTEGALNVSGINAVTYSGSQLAAGGNPLWRKMLEARNEVRHAFADVGGSAYVLNSGLETALEGTPRFSGGDTPCIEDGMLHGQPEFHSNVLGAAANGGIYGHWKSMKVATWGSMMFIMDDISNTTFQVLRVIGWFGNAAAYAKSFSSIKQSG